MSSGEKQTEHGVSYISLTKIFRKNARLEKTEEPKHFANGMKKYARRRKKIYEEN